MSRKRSKPKTKVTKITKKKNPQFKAGDRVEVQWEDAFSTGGTWSIFNAPEHSPYIVHNVGYVIFDDERGIKLTQGFYKNEGDAPMAAGEFFIPRGMVQKVTKI